MKQHSLLQLYNVHAHEYNWTVQSKNKKLKKKEYNRTAKPMLTRNFLKIFFLISLSAL